MDESSRHLKGEGKQEGEGKEEGGGRRRVREEGG